LTLRSRRKAEEKLRVENLRKRNKKEEDKLKKTVLVRLSKKMRVELPMVLQIQERKNPRKRGPFGGG